MPAVSASLNVPSILGGPMGHSQMVKASWCGAIQFLALLFPPVACFAQQLLWLGRLPSGGVSEAVAVSDSGTVVVGRAENINYFWRAFRWTAAEGMVALGTFGGSASEALGLSPNGAIVVGKAQDSIGRWRAFRWTPTEGMHDLGTLGGRESEAAAVAPSGLIVGRAANTSLQLRAFLWSTQTGMRDLGTLGGAESAALAIARDSVIVVGWAENADRQPRAFRWTPTEGMRDLGTLGGARSEAYGVSADGSVIVGRAENPDRLWRAFRWTPTEGMQDLGTLGGRESAALAVSADGSVVVGWAMTPTGDWHAFRWTPATGMQDLNVAYARAVGRSLLYVARGISADGRYIVGYGINAATGRQEAYLLDTEGQPSAAPVPLAGVGLSVEPHPVVGTGLLRCILPEATILHLRLTDAFGREYGTLATGWHAAGEYTYPLPLLAAGMYIVTAETTGAVVRFPFLVLR